MISIAVARALRDGGLVWKPQVGDWFVVADRGMDEDIFVLSDMTAELHEYPHGNVIGFNGTTEWALDSVEGDDAVWLPRESQLRDLLGSAFRALARTPDGWRVDLEVSGRAWHIEDADAEQAYALALRYLVRGE